MDCIIIAVTVVTAANTVIYHVDTDLSAIQHRDFQQEVAKLAFRDRDEVQVIRDLPGRLHNRHYRCGYETLYASLTGGVE